ncbi:hypothetical protein [Streptomyces flaveus]|uniref:hypothetical protein n=1 Tax=Streptomyces flaveus TaxID=66370 RepID=UPI00332C6EEE
MDALREYPEQVNLAETVQCVMETVRGGRGDQYDVRVSASADTHEETLAFPHPQSVEAFQRQLAPFRTHDTLDRLSETTAPTLVLAGELNIATPKTTAASTYDVPRERSSQNVWNEDAGRRLSAPSMSAGGRRRRFCLP